MKTSSTSASSSNTQPEQRTVLRCVCAGLFLLLLAGQTCWSAPISALPEIRAIVGEAAGQPYKVKLAVAAAIRNRGHLRGVYGLNARHNASEPERVWRDAARAWKESATSDITRGATHFGCAEDVRKGAFTGLQLTCIVGAGRDATYFYRVKSRS